MTSPRVTAERQMLEFYSHGNVHPTYDDMHKIADAIKTVLADLDNAQAQHEADRRVISGAIQVEDSLRMQLADAEKRIADMVTIEHADHMLCCCENRLQEASDRITTLEAQLTDAHKRVVDLDAEATNAIMLTMSQALRLSELEAENARLTQEVKAEAARAEVAEGYFNEKAYSLESDPANAREEIERLRGDKATLYANLQSERAVVTQFRDAERRLINELASARSNALEEVTKGIRELASDYCEGWCKESGGASKFDDCTGCEMLRALHKPKDPT